MSEGIIDSPGETIAGIISPAPFGPGTIKTPLLYPFGFLPLANFALGLLTAAPAADVWNAR